MKRFLFLLVLLFGLVALSGCGEGKKSYETGRNLYIQGEYAAAADSFRLAMSQGVKDPVVLADLALCYGKTGDTAQAEEWIGKALKKGSDDPSVLKRIGLTKYTLGEHAEALMYMKSAIGHIGPKMTEDDLETYAFAAAIEAENGLYEEALKLYGVIINQGYYSMEHQLLAGLAYLKLEQIDAAEQYFELMDAHRNVPADYYIKIYYGYKEIYEDIMAEKWFSAGLERLEDSGITKASYYARAGKDDEAMKLYEDEDTARDLLDYASRLMEEGAFSEAEEVILSVIETGKEEALAYYTYLLLKIQTGEWEDAERLFTKVRSYGDEALAEPLAWNEIMLYERMKDYKTAFSRLLDYRKAYPDEGKALPEYAFLSRIAETD